jgi:hypothetical protein
MPIYDYCDYLILCQLHCWLDCATVSFNCKTCPSPPLVFSSQGITQFLMKFVAKLTYSIEDITVLVFTCGFQDDISCADLNQ